MISYIKGNVTVKGEGYIVLENNGIGYHINVPAISRAYLVSPDEQITVFTEMTVREDDVSLYGFTDQLGLQLFRMLVTVNGVGAKAAMAIMSALSPMEVRSAIAFEDADMLTRAQGVGKKTAQRIVLELKDKIEKLGAGFEYGAPSGESAGRSSGGAAADGANAASKSNASPDDVSTADPGQSGDHQNPKGGTSGAFADGTDANSYMAVSRAKMEALEALVSLGYSRSEAQSALAKCKEDSEKTQDYIKAALKSLSIL